MAGPGYVIDKGFKASAAIVKFSIVKMDDVTTETVSTAAAATDPLLGVCQEEVTAADVTNGRVVDIRLFGISRCKVGATAVVPGTLGTAAAAGNVAAAVATNRSIGVILTKKAASVTGEHIDVLVAPGTA